MFVYSILSRTSHPSLSNNHFGKENCILESMPMFLQLENYIKNNLRVKHTRIELESSSASAFSISALRTCTSTILLWAWTVLFIWPIETVGISIASKTNWISYPIFREFSNRLKITQSNFCFAFLPYKCRRNYKYWNVDNINFGFQEYLPQRADLFQSKVQ